MGVVLAVDKMPGSPRRMTLLQPYSSGMRVSSSEHREAYNHSLLLLLHTPSTKLTSKNYDTYIINYNATEVKLNLILTSKSIEKHYNVHKMPISKNLVKYKSIFTCTVYMCQVL